MKSELYKLKVLLGRNIKLYFKDKMTFFVSLITPIILVILFLCFLKGVYENTIYSALPDGMEISKRAVNSFSGGWLFSSIISVSAVTVAFCSNPHVLDKINKTLIDFEISPIKRSTILTSYFISNFLTTFLVCLIVMGISFVYLGIVGFYMSFSDIAMLILSTLIMSAFGSLLSSLIGMFVSSQGAQAGLSSCISALYGFISGAYMPISQFGASMRNFVSLLPGTYGTVLIRKYYMNGIMNHLVDSEHIPSEIVDSLREAFDAKITSFGTAIPTWAAFVIVLASSAVLFALLIGVSYIIKKSSDRA